MMASESVCDQSGAFCDPCGSLHKSIPASKFCVDCEEQLCTECADGHMKYKAFRFHSIVGIDSLPGLSVLSSLQTKCVTHPDKGLDFYCTDHETLCCTVCITNSHRSCDKVTPLEDASKYIKNSTTLTDFFQEAHDISQTFLKLQQNREENERTIATSKASILQAIKVAKQRLIKQINDLEEKVTSDIEKLYENQKIKIKKEKAEITGNIQILERKKKEFEFLKNHGSTIQVFLAIHSNDIKKTKDRAEKMTSSIENLDIKFEPGKISINSIFGSVSETTQPCGVHFNSSKLQQAQVQPDKPKPVTGFIKDGEVKLKAGERYYLTDLAITTTNKLLLCNYHYSCPKVYAYTDCSDYDSEVKLSSQPYRITVIPGTDRAVVSLLQEKSIQFINTTTMTKEDKVNVGYMCLGVTAVTDRIFIGGGDGNVHILDTKGSHQRTVSVGWSGVIYNLHYYKDTNQILCRMWEEIRCTDIQGRLLHQYGTSEGYGMAVDHLGQLYIAGYWDNDIKKYSPQGELLDTVLTRDDGIDRPFGLLFNNNYTKLIVINNDGESVLTFKCT